MAVGDTCVSWLSYTSTNTISFKSHGLLFSHASAEARDKNTPERKVASTGDLKTTKSWVPHTHHWATWAGPMGKEEIASNQHFLFFPQCFIPFRRNITPFEPQWNFHFQMLSILTRLKFSFLPKAWKWKSYGEDFNKCWWPPILTAC